MSPFSRFSFLALSLTVLRLLSAGVATGMLTSLQEEGVCFWLNNSENIDGADKQLLAGVLIDKMEFLENTLTKTDG